MAEFQVAPLRQKKREMTARPELDECRTGHRQIFYSKAATCPLCALNSYVVTISKRLNETQVMVDHLKSMFFVDKH